LGIDSTKVIINFNHNIFI